MPANLSTKRCVGARCPCASWTDRAMRSRVVSPLREVTRNSSVPRSLMVPAKTVAPAVFSTGMLSPVIGAWFTDDCPRSEEHTSELQSHSDLGGRRIIRSEEHTSELQSHSDLVCRLLLEKKKNEATQ